MTDQTAETADVSTAQPTASRAKLTLVTPTPAIATVPTAEPVLAAACSNPGSTAPKQAKKRSGGFIKPTDLVHTYRVLARIPGGSKLKLDDHGKPVAINVIIGRGLALTVTGDAELLSAVDLIKGSMVQGTLTLTRSPTFPHRLTSVTFVAKSSLKQPRFQLQMFARLDENFSFDHRKGECGTLVRTSGGILKILKIAQEQPMALAA